MEPMSPRQRRIVLALGLGFLGFWATLCPMHGGCLGFDSINLWFGSVVLGQPCLLAIWTAFSRQPLAARLPRALGLCALLALLLAWSNRHAPAFMPLLSMDTCALIVSIFLENTLLLTLIRWRFGWRINGSSQVTGEPGTANQFSLRQLLTWTTGIAAVLAVARWLDQEGPDWEMLAGYTVLLGTLGPIYLFCIVPCIGCVLSRTSQRRFAVWVLHMAVLGVILQYAASLTSDYLGISFNAELEELVFVDLGCVLTVVTGLGVLRMCGYHLIRGTTALAPESVLPSEPAATASSSRWRSPFPYLVGTFLLLTLLLARPAWQIEQERRKYRADWWDAEPFRRLGVDARFERGHLRDVHFPPSQPVSEAALRLLPQYGDPPTVEYVSFSNTRLTDEFLPHLARLQNLEQLDLSNTAITDAGLDQLKSLNKLNRLNVSNTQVTAAGVRNILRDHPDCGVETSPGQIPGGFSP